ncbi:hypothetical protein Cthiooxydans_46640 [Comamonas thiooxydans]|uniref:hypothetical protein n=1 Tax=Comamonas thiooxydans TaxID=363952 RepID=UPI001E3810DD|nr:hypothetical protein [Comamonas thiooxydans]BDB72252.1 hypothetical protein Cthiooxydans_46640 [Comamonas thiooxydans]
MTTTYSNENSETTIKSNYVWWEKTVEYAFLKFVLLNGACDWAAPLAGNAETALSDALAKIEGKFVLIEFKRDKYSLYSESYKYYDETKSRENKEDPIIKQGYQKEDFQLAKEHIEKNFEKPLHYFIYGKLNGKNIDLLCTDYWNPDIKNSTKINAFVETEIGEDDKDKFDEYLVELAKLRHSVPKGQTDTSTDTDNDSDSGSGGGSSGPQTNSYVVAISSGSYSIVELKEFKNLRLERKNEEKKSNAEKAKAEVTVTSKRHTM